LVRLSAASRRSDDLYQSDVITSKVE